MANNEVDRADANSEDGDDEVSVDCEEESEGRAPGKKRRAADKMARDKGVRRKSAKLSCWHQQLERQVKHKIKAQK